MKIAKTCLFFIVLLGGFASLQCKRKCIYETRSPDGRILVQVFQKGMSIQKQSDRKGVCRFYEEPSNRLIGVFEVDMIMEVYDLNWERIKLDEGNIQSVSPAFTKIK